MNNEDYGNEPAHPQSGTEGASGDLNSSEEWGGSGLTKREHFAAMALQGLLSADTNGTYNQFADNSVKCADALLAALNQPQGE